MYAFYRKRVGKISILLIMALILTGTFAFQSFSQRAFNMAWEDGNYGGRIRDEYDGEGSGHHNKDVFAENFGSRPLLVGIRLREFYSINGNPVVAGSVIDDATTWPVFRAEPTDVHTPLAGTAFANQLHRPINEPNGIGIRWTLGHDVNSTDENRGPKYFMPTHNHATHLAEVVDVSVADLFAYPEAFRMTEAVGRGVDAIAMNAFNERFDETDMTSAEDFFVYGAQTAADVDADGSHDWWGPDDVITAPLIYTTDPELGPVVLRQSEPVPHTAQRTLEPSLIFAEGAFDTDEDRDEAVTTVLGAGVTVDNFQGVMTMTQFIALGSPAGHFWIHDDSNDEGWFFWNGWLPPREATSLLLDAIYLPSRQESWEHLIEVEGYFFSQETLELARTAMTMSPVAFAMFEELEAFRPPGSAPVDPNDPPINVPIACATLPETPAEVEDGVEVYLETPRTLNVVENSTPGYANTLRFSSASGRFTPRATAYVIYVDGVPVATHVPTGTQAEEAVSARWFDLDLLDLEPGAGYAIQVRAISDDPEIGSSGLSLSACFIIE